MIRQRTSRLEVDFQRSDQPLAIARKNAFGRGWIDPFDHTPQELDAAPVRNLLQPISQLGILSRSRKESARERTIIKACAAGNDGNAPALVYVGDNCRG